MSANKRNIGAARLAGVAIFAASSALAIGPDTWMEWLMWATTLTPVELLRAFLAAVAIAALLALVWPILSARSDSGSSAK